jgi:hypothetical protein
MKPDDFNDTAIVKCTYASMKTSSRSFYIRRDTLSRLLLLYLEVVCLIKANDK